MIKGGREINDKINQYKLQKLLNKGGEGQVWRANKDNKEVALKISTDNDEFQRQYLSPGLPYLVNLQFNTFEINDDYVIPYELLGPDLKKVCA